MDLKATIYCIALVVMALGGVAQGITCRGLGPNEYINGDNIDNYSGCTVIDGDLRIMADTFEGDRYANIPAVQPEQLYFLNSIQTINGHLVVQGKHEEFTSLDFLSNLQTIRGRSQSYLDAALQIQGTSIKSLELKSLKSIEDGFVAIGYNQELCFADTINWSLLFRRIDQRASLKFNKSPRRCQDESHVCDEECTDDGCWGEGNRNCIRCKNYIYDGQCIPYCYRAWGLYTQNDTHCERCHPECNECSGPGADQCYECKNYKYRDEMTGVETCVPRCPVNQLYFIDYDNNCRRCHEECQGGCSGEGPEDCFECENQMDDNRCVARCPRNKYDDSLNMCQFCHSECAGGCSGPGNGNCTQCRNMIDDGKCVTVCPVDKYADYNQECQLCDRQCAGGCSGPGSRNCFECRNVKDGDYCVELCPLDKYADDTNECRSCDEQCSGGCIGPGPLACLQCKSYSYDGGCVESCPYETYPDSSSECQPCHPECEGGCTGAGPSQCIACRNFRDGSRCVSRCPPDRCADTNNACGPCGQAMPTFEQLVTQVRVLQDQASEMKSYMDNAPSVYFSAYSTPDRMDYYSGDHIMFDGVITNIGGAYNPDTSIFECPQTGLYLFAVSVDNYMRGSLVPSIYKERELIASAGGYNSASQTVIVQCEEGNDVYVRTNQAGTLFNMYGWKTSTFTGYLLANGKY